MLYGDKIGGVGAQTKGENIATDSDHGDTISWAAGTNAVDDVASDQFSASSTGGRWTLGVQPLHLAPGAYTLKGLNLRMEGVVEGAGPYTATSDFFEIGIAQWNPDTKVLTPYSGCQYNAQDDIVTTYPDKTPGTDFSCEFSALSGWTDMAFTVSTGEEVYVYCAIHHLSTRATTYAPQIDTVDAAVHDSLTVYNLTASDGPSEVPTSGYSIKSDTNPWARGVVIESTVNLVLDLQGTAVAPSLGASDTLLHVELPIRSAGSYWIFLNNVNINEADEIVIELGAYNTSGTADTIGKFKLDFDVASGNDNLITWDPDGTPQSHTLRDKVDNNCDIDIALSVDPDNNLLDLFWSNQTIGGGTEQLKGSTTVVSTTSTTITCTTGELATIGAVAGDYAVFPNGHNYYITDVTGDVLTVTGNPSTESGALDICNYRDFHIGCLSVAIDTDRNDPGLAYLTGTTEPYWMRITAGGVGSTIDNVQVAQKIAVLFGDSQWQPDAGGGDLADNLPGAFTETYPSIRAYMGGNYWCSEYGSSVLSSTDGWKRFCNDTPGDGDICEMKNMLLIWGGYGVNDCLNMGSTVAGQQTWTARFIKRFAQMVEYLITNNCELITITPCPIYYPWTTLSSDGEDDCSAILTTALAATTQAGRGTVINIWNLITNNRGSYLGEGSDNYHFSDPGAAEISRRAVVAYEGQTVRI